MPTLLPPLPVKLAFNPTTIKAPIFQTLWDDALARAIWLLWKPRHLTSDNFNTACLAFADGLRRHPQPWTVETMKQVNFWCEEFPRADLERWGPEALPFLHAPETVTWRNVNAPD